MFLALVLLLIGAALIGILAYATITAHRRQTQLHNKKEASQLQRRADHLFKIALATQVHTPRNEIAKTLLQEAIRVLDYASTLDPTLTATTVSLRECHALLASTEQDVAAGTSRDSILEFPETELIEAQLHLTEASRLLMGLEKRGLVGYEQLPLMLTDIKQAQRGLDLRLQLRQAAASIGMERTIEKIGEHVESERDKTQLSR
jgi:hypothetical protein